MEGHRFVTLPAPADASARIIPCPIPWVDPVTRATRPARDIEAEGEWQRERERERKQRESRRNREREGEEAEREPKKQREREREREKVKNFHSERKNDVEGALDLSSSLNILKNPQPNPLVVLFCVTSSACFTMTIRSHSDAGTIAEIPHYGIR